MFITIIRFHFSSLRSVNSLLGKFPEKAALFSNMSMPPHFSAVTRAFRSHLLHPEHPLSCLFSRVSIRKWHQPEISTPLITAAPSHAVEWAIANTHTITAIHLLINVFCVLLNQHRIPLLSLIDHLLGLFLPNRI